MVSTPLNAPTARSVRSADVWNWLPTFATVAQYGGITKAAKQLRLSAPAVSRTIRQLEEHLGYSLFERSASGLRVNAAGQLLARHVTSSLSAIDAGLAAIFSDKQELPLRIATMGQLGRTHLAPALSRLRNLAPNAAVVVAELDARQSIEALLRDSVDILLGFNLARNDALEIQPVAESPVGIYFGQGHPLFDKPQVMLENLLEHPFAVPPESSLEGRGAVWPVHIQRRVGLVAPDAVALESCLSGAMLMAMSERSAASFVAAGSLRGIRADFVATPQIEVATRRGGVTHPVLPTLVELLRTA